MHRLRTAHGQFLRKAMSDARVAFVEAQSRYHRAIEAAMYGGHADGKFVLRTEGHAYASALHRYSEAAMAWLAFVDTTLPGNKG